MSDHCHVCGRDGRVEDHPICAAQTGRAPKEGDLRVWWIPQIPMKAFTVRVESLSQAKFLLRTLADYDKFQFENRVKPDYSNAGGLQEFDGSDWFDWSSEEGEDVDALSSLRASILEEERKRKRM